VDALIIVVFFFALNVLATRYGYDSRDGLPSAEEDLARKGFVWDWLSCPSDPVR
jgi:hypothetical protein